VPQLTWEEQPIPPKGEVIKGLVDWSGTHAVGRAVVAAAVDVVVDVILCEWLGGVLVLERSIRHGIEVGVKFAMDDHFVVLLQM
jgi:hypothetical protein